MKGTIVIKIDPEKPDRRMMAYAGRVIREGGLVVFPTETVYGIAASRLNEKAMRDLRKVKKRPKGKPFTVHVSNVTAVEKMKCVVTKEARKLMARFWPGPLTIILRSKSGEKIGFRMPANPAALALIDAARVPVVAPSANVSGGRPPATADEVLRNLDGKIELLIDTGPTDMGVESTVVDLTVTPFRILRAGAIKRAEITKFQETITKQ